MPVTLPDNRDRRAWQAAIWDAPPSELSGPQRIEFMRMLESPYEIDGPGIDPFQIVRGLLDNRILWDVATVVISYPFYGQVAETAHLVIYPDLAELFAVSTGDWRPDALYLLHQSARSEELIALSEDWHPVEVQVWDYDSHSNLYDWLGMTPTHNVFRMWWE